MSYDPNVCDAVEALDVTHARALFKALEVAIEQLGVHTPIRQLMALIAIALANRRGDTIGVRDIDRELGDLPSGSASKLLRTMMHVEGERKPGVADTVVSKRDAEDLRKWNLYLTPKGADALINILDGMKLISRNRPKA